MSSPNQSMTLLAATAVTTAGTVTGAAGVGTGLVSGLGGVTYLAAQCKFTYGSGGTSVAVYLQTTLDQGATWVDIAAWNFTTASATKDSKLSAYAAMSAAVAPTDASLTANSILDGLLGDQFRIKIVSVGTYSATTVAVNIVTKGSYR